MPAHNQRQKNGLLLVSRHWLGSRASTCCSKLARLTRLAAHPLSLIFTTHTTSNNYSKHHRRSVVYPLCELMRSPCQLTYRHSHQKGTQRERVPHHCLTNSVKSPQTGHSRIRPPSVLTQPSHKQRHRQLKPRWVGGFAAHFTHISGTDRSASGSGRGTERAAVSARRRSRDMRR